MTAQTSRRSFLARLSAFLGGAAAVPGLVEAAPVEPNHEPFQAGTESERKTECSTVTDVDVVYVVTKAILDAQPGDHVIVRDSHSALHRYLTYLDLNAMLQSGALEWVRDITPTSRMRTVEHQEPDGAR